MKKSSVRNIVSVMLIISLMLVAALCVTSCTDEPQGYPAPPPQEETSGSGSDSGTETETESTHPHEYGEGTVEAQPTCVGEGTMVYECSICGYKKSEPIQPTGVHTFENWVEVTAPTFNTEGLESSKCTYCEEVSERAIAKVIATYYITINDGMGGTIEWGVDSDGVYTLEAPVRIGYNFRGWKDADGNVFEQSGTISSNLSIWVQWELDDTDTIEELAERAAAGVDRIRITKDIIIDRPIYVVGNVNIYAEKAVKLIRSEKYDGDLFVIGQDETGESAIMLGRPTLLTLGLADGSQKDVVLTIDGNKDKLKVNVVGSALFMIDGGSVNMYDGVSLSNHIKTGNKRAHEQDWSCGISSNNVGGAAAIIASGSAFHMYGGIIDNNSVNTTSVTNESGEKITISAYGGAIYNGGSFRMYGGVISNNDANRGGGIYSDRVTKIYAGVLEGNSATNKGGAICSSGSDSADTIISTEGAKENTVIFRNNTATKQGGAILSYFDSPIVIYDGVLFEGNTAQTGNGGAISTSGPVTAYNAKFINNTANGRGGAIYQEYTGGGRAIRILELEGCLIEGNRANKGGAINVTSSDDSGKGTIAEITNCQFINNTAFLKITEKVDSTTGETTTSKSTGNGGAIYSSQNSTVTVSGCEFIGNKAENLGGGAIGATVSSTIKIDNSKFINNSAADADGTENGRSGVGGALYVYNKSAVTVKNSIFDGNSAASNGGAIYSSDNTVTLENVTMTNNSANNGGAIAQFSGSVVTVKGIVATGNTARIYGGIIYNSKSTTSLLTGNGIVTQLGKLGSTDEETLALQNSALSGGAICAGNTSTVTIESATIENNAAIPASDVTADYKGYGGALFVMYGSQVTVSNSSIAANHAKYGGAATATKSGTVLTIQNSTLDSNTSTNCGGGLYVLEATAGLVNVTAQNNISAKGGVLYLSAQSSATVSGQSSFSGNSATYGGAAYISGAKLANFDGATFTNNGKSENKPASEGGVFYIVRSGATVENCNFENNASTSKGGAIFLESTETTTNEQGEEKTTSPATITLKSSEFIGNTSKTGGAICALVDSHATLNSVTFENNSAAGADSTADARGGAIYTLGATLEATNTEFTGNTANKYGGAVDAHTNSTLTLTGVLFTNNSANDNGGAMWAYTNTKIDITGIEAYGNASGSYGGFIYTRGELNIISGQNVVNVFGKEGEGFENSAIKRGGVISGGASSTVNISGAQFVNNYATAGGALHSSSVMNVSSSTFSGNEAHLKNVTSTGAVYLDAGGAIHGDTGSTTTITDCSFESNVTYVPAASTSSDTRIYGGAISAFGSNSSMTITSSSFDSNGFANPTETLEYTVKTYGGAVGATNGVTLSISNNTEFENNSAKYGGALAVAANDGKKATLDTVSLTQNTAANCGGAIYLNDMAAEIKNITATANTATNTGGGAIYVSGCNGVTVEGSSLSSNITGGNGGAIYSSSFISISETSLSENTASKGGALYFSGKANVSNNTFTSNTATEKGGAIYVGSSVTSTVECTFTSNSATSGGAMYVAENATLNDGIDTLDGETPVVNSGSTFTSNTATGNGGAIYLGGVADPEEDPDHVGALASIEGATFTGNSATYGGAIHVYMGASLTDDGSVYTNNTASKRGGAIGTSYDGDLTAAAVILDISNAKFHNNKAVPDTNDGRGGAIYVTEYHTVKIDSSEFKNNEVSQYGGAISVARGATVEISDSSFTQNAASSNGGAIWTYHESTLSISGSTFDSNTATSTGGAIYTYNILTVTGSTFSSNEANKGGAIYAAGQTDVSASQFTGNSATETAGAIYANGNTTTLVNVIATQNSSGIYVSKGTVSISGTVIIKENTSGNLSLADGLVVTVAGVLGQDSSIGVTNLTDNGVVAVPDGVNVFDLSAYENNFFHSSGQPVLAIGNGTLMYGFALLTPPTSFNGFTVATSGSPTYQWYNYENGEIGEAAAGQTTASLTSGVVGQTYVCVATLNGETVTTDPIIYTNSPTSSHPICGATCSDQTHQAVTFLPINNLAELQVAAVTDGYYYLTADLTLNSNVTISADVTICLNGKTLTRAASEEVFSMITVAEGATLTLTDCSTTEVAGYIDPTDKLWKPGSYSGEDTAIAVTLKGGMITGGNGNYGGAIYVYGSLTTYGINFVNNKATRSGAVYAKADSSYTDYGSIFVSNITSGQSGAIETYGNTTLNDSKFIGNASTANRGGALLAAGGTFTANNVLFDSNAATTNGGAVVITGMKTSVATFNNCTFKNNSADAKAGALYIHDSTAITKSCLFESNSSASGGAIATSTSGLYTDGVDGSSADGSTFKGNSATNGGALHLTNDANLFGSKFVENAATESGGAIMSIYQKNITIKNAQFNGNTATTNGGAIAATNKSIVEISDSSFTSNTATLGGAVYTASAATATNCTFTSNSATEEGGAVYVGNAASYTDSGSTYTSNSAGTYGGAISSTAESGEGGAIISLTDCEFSENSATTRGGAIHAYGEGTALTVVRGEMTKNKTTGSNDYGGAVSVHTKASVTMNGTELTENDGGSGGAISVYTSTTTNVLTNITLTSNTGGNGTIYIGAGAGVLVNNLTATNNSSTGYGGVIYLTSAGSTVTVNSATVSGNTYRSGTGFIQTGNATAEARVYKAGITYEGVTGDQITNWDEIVVPKNSTTALLVTYIDTPVSIAE